MMEGSSIDYLTKIPDELKIAIFSYLDTYDVMQLYDVSASFQDIIFDKDIISKIRVYKEYSFTKAHLNTILTKARIETITSLNINCVYWISAPVLRNCIYKLPMLECLYVVDTELSLIPRDCAMYSTLSHLKTIALTVRDSGILKSSRLPDTITELCLSLNVMPRPGSRMVHLPCLHPWVTQLLGKLKHLQKLWIIQLGNVYYPPLGYLLSEILRISSSLKKLTFTGNIEPGIDFSGNLQSFVTMFKSNTAEEICLEKFDRDVNPIYRHWNSHDPIWDQLINGLKYGPPFCQSDARKLILKQATVQNMQFSELNLTHKSADCSKQLKSTLRVLLVSSNMKSLKKLSINICLCEQTSYEPPDDQLLSKSSRMSMMSKLPNQCTLEKVIQNSPLIEELEIWGCESVLNDLLQVTDSALSSIRNLKHLRKLTITGLPKHLSGEHLVEICKSCTKLESLRITIYGRNDNVNSHICTALLHTTALKDFRYEQDHIPIDEIVDSLNSVETSKLQRLVLQCETIESVNLSLFETFLSTKHQLRFVCLLVNEVSRNLFQQISRSMAKHSVSPDNFFLISDLCIFLHWSPIPQIHTLEMLKLLTWVSVLDKFNGFENY